MQLNIIMNNTYVNLDEKINNLKPIIKKTEFNNHRELINQIKINKDL
jgi:hypothetical protein